MSAFSVRRCLATSTACLAVVGFMVLLSQWQNIANYGRTEDLFLAQPWINAPPGQDGPGNEEEEDVEIEEVIEYVDEPEEEVAAAQAAVENNAQGGAEGITTGGKSAGIADGAGGGGKGGVGSAGEDVEEDATPGTSVTSVKIKMDEWGSIRPKYDSESPLCLALAADLDQLENVVVVINSTIVHSRKPHLLLFRIITLKADQQKMLDQLKTRFPASVNIEAVPFDPWLKRVSRLVGGTSSGRQELFNELNFAAFYVHELLPTMKRVLYLDTDVVVLGDVQAELSEWNMQGHPVGGARDCSQRVGKYIHFNRISGLGNETGLPLQIKAKKEDCVVNRGVVLIQTDVWAARDMTGLIEKLVQIHLSDQGPLWHSGVSQPPFLLAIAGRYMNMGYQYNVRGLGRQDMTVDEVRHWKHSPLWKKYFDKFLYICKFGQRKNWAFAPTIVVGAYAAKVIHFNGRLKPIGRGRCSDKPVPPPSKTMKDSDREIFESRPLCSCGENCMQECAGIWWRYNNALELNSAG